MRDVYEERLSANRGDEGSATQRVDGISGSAGANVESCVLVGVDSLPYWSADGHQLTDVSDLCVH